MRRTEYIASMLVEFIWNTDEITLIFEQAVQRTGFAMTNSIYRRRNRIYISYIYMYIYIYTYIYESYIYVYIHIHIYIYDIWGKGLLNDI
jgi:hypothetical protein